MADDDVPVYSGGSKPTPRLAGIIWGNAKVGKTTYAASSPGRKFVINLDPEGWLSVGDREDTTVWDYSGLEPYDLVDGIVKNIGSKIVNSGAEAGDTFMFDSVTMFNQAALLTAIRNGVGSSNKFKPSIETPGLAAYGARTQYLIAAMGAAIRATRRLNCHVWFMAHEDTPERNEKGDFLYQSILMSENAINQSSASISEIWRMTEKDNSRTVEIRQTSTHKPMGTRMFSTEQAKSFKPKYDPTKPLLDQPHSIASLWKAYVDGGQKKLDVPS